MRRFIYKLIIFCIPVIIMELELLLPLSTFTFRPDEGLLYRHEGVGMPFYPNHKLEMLSQGDLCPYTDFAIDKNILWTTDSLGYRNDQFTNEPDILLFGDSFLLGSGLTQDSTFTNLLRVKINNELNLYHLAPATFSDLKLYFDKEIIKVPQLIIFVMGERGIPDTIIGKNDDFIFKNSFTRIFKSKATRFYALNFVKARLFDKETLGVQGQLRPDMFFLNGENIHYDQDAIDTVVEVLEFYKNFCDTLGIGFLFLPVPNKESVYYESIPLSKQPSYLFELDVKLRERDISTINTLKMFNDYRQKNNTLIYHLDDSHWNSNGVNLIVEETFKYINSSPLFSKILNTRY